MIFPLWTCFNGKGFNAVVVCVKSWVVIQLKVYTKHNNCDVG